MAIGKWFNLQALCPSWRSGRKNSKCQSSNFYHWKFQRFQKLCARNGDEDQINCFFLKSTITMMTEKCYKFIFTVLKVCWTLGLWSVSRAVWCRVSIRLCLLKFCLPSPAGSASGKAEGMFRRRAPIPKKSERDLEPRLKTSDILNGEIRQLRVRLVPFCVVSMPKGER